MRAQDLLLAASRWRVAEWALLVCALAAPLIWPARAWLVSEVAIAALFALSLDLVLGYCGIVSLGHAAFFGLGAYTAGLYAKLGGPDPLLGLALALLLSAAAGALCSLSVMRGSDLTRLMVTLATSLIFLELANKFDGISGGADGLQGLVLGPVLGLFAFDLAGRTAAYYALAVLGLVLWLLRRLVHSPLGAQIKAVRDNPVRAQAVGISVPALIGLVYTTAAGIAGLAGGLLAQTTGFVSLDVFAVERSANLLLMLVIGGTGWLYGGVLGALVFKLLQELLSALTPQYWMFWLGLVFVVLALRGHGAWRKPWPWRQGRA